MTEREFEDLLVDEKVKLNPRFVLAGAFLFAVFVVMLILIIVFVIQDSVSEEARLESVSDQHITGLFSIHDDSQSVIVSESTIHNSTASPMTAGVQIRFFYNNSDESL